MPTVTFALLGMGLLLAPAPLLAERRLAWLAPRWGAPRQAPQGAPQWTAQWAAQGAPQWTAQRRPPMPAAALRMLTGGRSAGTRVGSAVGLAAGLATGLAVGPVPGVLAALTSWVLGRGAGLLAAERDSERSRAELVATVGALHDEYAAGAALTAALSAAATVSGRYEAAVTRAAVRAATGEEVAATLRAEASLASLAVAFDIAGRLGASLAQSLVGVQADLAADQRTYRTVRTALAGPRSSALLLAALPLVGLAMGWGMGAHPERVLLHTTAGLLALTAGVVLDLAGLLWTLALSRRALP